MPVIALYNFDETTGTTVHDSALGNGAQNGMYINGASPAGGEAMLDGRNDLVKILANPVFQMDSGTLNIAFSQSSASGCRPETILSRDSAGVTQGGFRIEILASGAIVIAHEGAAGTETFGTGPGFMAPGDDIKLSYSWDEGGTGGKLVIENTTAGTAFADDVPNSLTMDMGAINQPWIVGAGQSLSSPAILNDINQHFHGTVSMFSISDTVDNLGTVNDGIVSGTEGDDLIDLAYTGDPDGDRIDRGDAIIAGQGPDDDIVVAGGGNDTVLAGLGNDLIYGGGGNDVIHGGPGDDTIDGGDGNDTLHGGNGSDLVDGGDGDDLIDTSGSRAPLPDRGYPGLYPADGDPMNDRDTVYGGAGNDTITTGDDNDLIFGGSGNDLIDGGIDDDTIHGGSGDDTMIGGEGSDVVFGGDGNDLIYGGLSPEFPDAINIPDATDLRPDNGRDTLFGGAGNDTIFGMDDDDILRGGDGNDYLDGGIDDDTLHGDEGNDTLIGGEGTDVMFGGADRDTFIGATAGDQIDGGEEGDDYDTLDLRGLGPRQVIYDPANSENGTVNFLDSDGNLTGTMAFVNIENVVCFTPGTMIATPKGEVPVENLRPGDKVITRDNGIQEIRWTGRKVMDWRALTANPHLKPILVRQGALGNGLPERDMMLSPNHRVLVANDRTALYFDEHEVLVAAKHLVGGAGIHEVDSIGTTYLHFMFDRHEVVLSNGAWTESFQPGDYTLKGMGNSQRNEIFELFPDLKTPAGLDAYGAARKTLKRHEARLLVQ
ncbi:Hint domain-containing protein [Paracoccaceae bacterium Fryx2]|nr:Hint domain-containing protein [Paracoccaceae bacterium Fryx2]